MVVKLNNGAVREIKKAEKIFEKRGGARRTEDKK